jgi:hypothetical protein
MGHCDLSEHDNRALGTHCLCMLDDVVVSLSVCGDVSKTCDEKQWLTIQTLRNHNTFPRFDFYLRRGHSLSDLI